MKSIVGLFLLVTWIAGVVIAAGWLKLLAGVFPFYAWYLIVEKAMQSIGVI